LSILLLVNVGHKEADATVLRLAREFIQNNLVGMPLVHTVQEFDFDPEVSQKRREQYYEVRNKGLN
jgi:hypothetical protein